MCPPLGLRADPVQLHDGRSGLHLVMVRAFAGGTFVGELALQISVEVGAPLGGGSLPHFCSV